MDLHFVVRLGALSWMDLYSVDLFSLQNHLSAPSAEMSKGISEHLLAELEQAGHQMKKKEQQAEAPKLKKLEGQQKEDSPGPKDGSPAGRQGGEKKRYRFFLTEGGCRRGKECQWLHEKDDKRRC